MLKDFEFPQLFLIYVVSIHTLSFKDVDEKLFLSLFSRMFVGFKEVISDLFNKLEIKYFQIMWQNKI